MARLDDDGITILELSDKSAAAVDKTRVAAGEGNADLLTGVTVVLENHRPALAPGQQPIAGAPPISIVRVGGSTLDEALKETIYAYDAGCSGVPGDPSEFDPPEWVASDNGQLAKLLAEHYTNDEHECGVRKLSEVGA